jgi:hypothetical protein
VRLDVGVGVVKHVGRQVAGDREAEAAVIEVVDDVDRVRSKLPPGQRTRLAFVLRLSLCVRSIG